MDPDCNHRYLCKGAAEENLTTDKVIDARIKARCISRQRAERGADEREIKYKMVSDV